MKEIGQLGTPPVVALRYVFLFWFSQWFPLPLLVDGLVSFDFFDFPTKAQWIPEPLTISLGWEIQPSAPKQVFCR